MWSVGDFCPAHNYYYFFNFVKMKIVFINFEIMIQYNKIDTFKR